MTDCEVNIFAVNIKEVLLQRNINVEEEKKPTLGHESYPRF